MAPGTKMGRIVLPSTPRGSLLILVAREDHGDFDTSDETHFYFDAHSGELLLRRDLGSERSRAGDAVMKWLGPLHFGSFGGIGIKLLWALFGLSLPVLATTGLWMWLRGIR